MEELIAKTEGVNIDGSASSQYVGLIKRQENGTLSLYQDEESDTLQFYNIKDMTLLAKHSVIKRDLTNVEESEKVAHRLLEKAVRRWTPKLHDLSSTSLVKAEVTKFEKAYVGILKPFVLSDKKSNGQNSCSYGFFFNSEIAQWADIRPLIDDLFSCTRRVTLQPDIIILKIPKVQLIQTQYVELTKNRDNYRFVGINSGNVPLKRWTNENYESSPKKKTPVAEVIFIFVNHVNDENPALPSTHSIPYCLPRREDVEKHRGITNIGKSRICKLSITNFLKCESNYVVFLGEGNFSFCASVASLRKTWCNLVPSDIKDAPEYDVLLNETCTNIITDYQSITGDEDLSYRVIEFISDLYLLDGSMYLTKCIDATDLRKDMNDLIQPRALFFNCPWVGRMEGNEHNVVAQFFESAKNYQVRGNLIFLGISIADFYRKRYGLFDENEELKCPDGYVLRGADTSFGRQMIERGYRHQSCSKDIHHTIKETHVVLVYEREGEIYCDHCEM